MAAGYGPGVDQPICMIEASGTYAGAYYYHFDGLGSVVALSDADGDTVQTYEYSVFGEPAASDPNHPNPFLFTARRYDRETGLYHYRARMYNPYIGRFLQTDPAGGSNLYSYCSNNPTGFTDPSGCHQMDRYYHYHVSAPASIFFEEDPLTQTTGNISYWVDEWCSKMGLFDGYPAWYMYYNGLNEDGTLDLVVQYSMWAQDVAEGIVGIPDVAVNYVDTRFTSYRGVVWPGRGKDGPVLTPVLTVGGTRMLDHDTLMRIMRPTFNYIWSWRRPSTFISTIWEYASVSACLSTLDSPFHKAETPARWKWAGDRQVYHKSEINYAAQGLAHYFLRIPLAVGQGLCWAHKNQINSSVTPGVEYWYNYGYFSLGWLWWENTSILKIWMEG